MDVWCSEGSSSHFTNFERAVFEIETRTNSSRVFYLLLDAMLVDSRLLLAISVVKFPPQHKLLVYPEQNFETLWMV